MEKVPPTELVRKVPLGFTSEEELPGSFILTIIKQVFQVQKKQPLNF
ncbi:hypothetical protein A961_577 [Enterococcus faecalis ATCC 29212]|nr:hypothetical protein A961_577 [Enterococcus faecalis ATCC 29212]